MSTVFRVQKSANYTTMSNYHLKDRRLSYKAKGLLSVILSLPDEWDYSLRGLSYIANDGIDSVRNTVRELERFGYIARGAQTRDERGRMSAGEYYVYENPSENPHFKPEEENGSVEPNPTALENPTRTSSPVPTALDFPTTEKPMTENPTTDTDYNNKILNNQILINQSIQTEDRTDGTENQGETFFHSSALKEKDRDDNSRCREIIRRNIGYDDNYANSPNKQRVNEFVELMVDVICSSGKTVRVNGAEIPREIVKSRLLKITSLHIDYVLDALERAAPDIRNIRAYLITALYNAPVTQDNYYAAWVRSNFAAK